MRIKTQAILIDEETYPIAVACLPSGFAELPFDNVLGYYLVINTLGTYANDEYQSQVISFRNLWISPSDFSENFKIINSKPGRKPEGAYWVEVERAVDVELKRQLDEVDDGSGGRVNVGPYGRKAARVRRHVPGFFRG